MYQHRKEFIIDTNYTYMTRRIGNTNYRIKVVLSSTATETFEEKLLRLVRNDSNLSCGEETHHETETE